MSPAQGQNGRLGFPMGCTSTVAAGNGVLKFDPSQGPNMNRPSPIRGFSCNNPIVGRL